MPSAPHTPTETLASRSVLRSVLILVTVVFALYLIVQLRTPLTWLLIATVLAVPLAMLVSRLERVMPRPVAIAVVYLALILTPVGLGAILVPPLVTEGNKLINDLPQYAQDVSDFVQNNERLRSLEADYDITSRLEQQADTLPQRIGDAASILQDVGFGLVNSLFAIVTILILSVFMVSSGPLWARRLIELQPPERADQLNRVLNRVAAAVSGYFAGALAVAIIGGLANFIVMTILGVPFAGPLAVMSGLASLIPMVGASIAAFLIALVTVFADFPTTTLIWIVWAVVYQQFENNVIQPQIQKRTVKVTPFVTIVAVLLGGSLLGVLGALLAIPVAASIQIVLNEWWGARQQSVLPPPGHDGPALPVSVHEQASGDTDASPSPPAPPQDDAGPAASPA